MAELAKKDKQLLIFDRLAEELIKGLRTHIPQSGYFRPFGFRFEIIGSRNAGLMQVEHYQEDKRMLKFGVFRKDTDRLYSNYILTGTNEDLIGHLESADRIPQWLETLEHLSQRVDAYF